MNNTEGTTSTPETASPAGDDLYMPPRPDWIDDERWAKIRKLARSHAQGLVDERERCPYAWCTEIDHGPDGWHASDDVEIPARKGLMTAHVSQEADGPITFSLTDGPSSGPLSDGARHWSLDLRQLIGVLTAVATQDGHNALIELVRQVLEAGHRPRR